jgi:hypothetical protein
MFDEEASRNFYDQIRTLWIEPEIRRRRDAGGIPDDFLIYRCLVKLPRDSKPVVEFNDEIQWQATLKFPQSRDIKQGEAIHLHEVERIVSVAPPEVDGKRVAFVYLYTTGTGYAGVFDFAPNDLDRMLSPQAKDEWSLGEHIAESLQALLVERVIRTHDDVQEALQGIGLWVAPALLPYPLGKIVYFLKRDVPNEARRLLISHCSASFLGSLTAKWWQLKEFDARRRLIDDALSAHGGSKYALSICALLPHLEGIITDWIYTQVPQEDIPWRQESKILKFRDIISSGPSTTYTYKCVVESTVDFILAGPVLSTFKTWFESIDTSFANRNVVGHGKYQDDLYVEENSIKLVLLLDTVYHIIAGKDSKKGQTSKSV